MKTYNKLSVSDLQNLFSESGNGELSLQRHVSEGAGRRDKDVYKLLGEAEANWPGSGAQNGTEQTVSDGDWLKIVSAGLKAWDAWMISRNELDTQQQSKSQLVDGQVTFRDGTKLANDQRRTAIMDFRFSTIFFDRFQFPTFSETVNGVKRFDSIIWAESDQVLADEDKPLGPVTVNGINYAALSRRHGVNDFFNAPLGYALKPLIATLGIAVAVNPEVYSVCLSSQGKGVTIEAQLFD